MSLHYLVKCQVSSTCLLSQLLSKATVTSFRSSAGILHGCLQQDDAPSHCDEHTDVPAAWERHLHRASHVAPKQPGLESSRLHCLVCPSTDGLSTSTIHDNQPPEAGNRHWMHGTNYCSVLSIAPLVSGVAGLSRSSHSKANKLNIWCKKCSMWVTLDNNWDNKHVVPCR